MILTLFSLAPRAGSVDAIWRLIHPPALTVARVLGSCRADSARLRAMWRSIVRIRAADQPSYRILCFPAAGGGASTYWSWAGYAPPNADLLAIRLPGRESRIRESPYASMEEAIASIATDAADLLDLPLAILGQCSGAIMGFELALALNLSRGVVGVSGQVASKVVAARRSSPVPTDGELIEELGEGIPRIVRENPEFLDLALTAIRSDMQMLETYAPTPRPVGVPIVGFHGRNDQLVSESDVIDWRHRTAASFSMVSVGAGHLMTSGDASTVFEALGAYIAT
jgi:surfactin synthase thioesterase subunit